MTFIKKITFVLVVLLALATCGIFALTKSVTPAALKDIVNKQLSTLTTQKSHIAGDISWHLFPRPGIKVTNIYASESENKTNYAVSIDNLLFNLQVTPLLRGQLVFNELLIDGIKINIHPENQTDLTVSQIPVVATTPQPIESNKVSAQFALRSMLLTHGEIIINQPNNKIKLSGLQIGAKQLGLSNDSFSLQLRGNFIASIADNKARATLNYNGRVHLTPSTFTQPMVALDLATMDGQLVIQNLRYNHFKIAKISTNIKKKQKVISLNPFNISLYSGKSVGDIKYEFPSQKLTMNQTATGLDANQFFNDLFTKTLVKGQLDFSVHASTNLLNNAWKNNMRWNGNLTIKNGALYFVDLNKYTDEAISKLHGLLSQEKLPVKLSLGKTLLDLKGRTPFAPTIAPKPSVTKFQLLSIQYHLIDTQLITDNLVLQTDTLQLRGSGAVNLIDGSQDLNLSAKLTSNDLEIEKIQQQLGGSFPLRICGTLTKPQVLPNMQGLGPVISSYLLKNTLERPVKQIRNHLESLLTTTENLIP